ncbi:hypothetical protein ACUODF_48950, partial [Escherichia coli]
ANAAGRLLVITVIFLAVINPSAISIDAVNGITTFNEGYSVSGAMVTAANKVIAVLDSSKFNRRGFNQVLPIEKIDIIITDDAVSEVDKLALQKTRVKLITV